MPRQLLILTAACIALISLLLSLSFGSTTLSIAQLFYPHHNQIDALLLNMRLARTLAAFVCGSLLGLAGALMQLLLQNPLADPYVLGISGGAALFTLISLLVGMSGDWIIISAWAGSLLTICIVTLLGHKHNWHTHTLLLTGIALACGYSAGISLVLLLAPDDHLHNMLFWLNGDLNGATFPYTGVSILGLGLLCCMLLAPGLNLLNRGELEAQALGLATTKYRAYIYLLSSLFTATAVSIAGCVAFVGLITPHISRRLVGHDHRINLITTTLLGGALVTAADTIARTIIAPEQIPVGIFLALIGVPVFVWILQK